MTAWALGKEPPLETRFLAAAPSGLLWHLPAPWCAAGSVGAGFSASDVGLGRFALFQPSRPTPATCTCGRQSKKPTGKTVGLGQMTFGFVLRGQSIAATSC